MVELQHPDENDLELYVIGAHDQIAVGEIEEHVASCERCATQVERHARLELQLYELADAARFCPGCDRVVSRGRCTHCGAALAPGGYDVERVIVQTAHGRLYLARDTDGRRVALKELVFTQVPTMATVEAFEKEGRLLQQLRHPRIPRFVASFREGEGVETRLYLAQEYVEGRSLLARSADHRFSEAEVSDIARQVLEVLVYLQGLSPQIFHRDVKPANLIQRPDGTIVLVDFGSARDLGATTGATLAGTFGYMPVEQMVGIVDATSDLYALGASMCHLLSRVPPWKVLELGIARSKMNVSPRMLRFLARLTAQRPEARFASAREALAALDAVDRAEPRRFVVRAGLAAIALAAAGVAGYGLRSPPVVVEVPQVPVVQVIEPVRAPEPSPLPPPDVETREPPEPPPPPRVRPRIVREKAPALVRTKELHDAAWRAWTYGDSGKAIELLEECVEVGGLGKCHRMLGAVYAQIGDTRRAVHHYRMYVQLDPNAPDAMRIREIIEDSSAAP